MAESKSKLEVAVTKASPYTFDLGLLLANDPNPVPECSAAELESTLSEIARDGAQSLINNLLLTCPVSSTSSGVLLTLPPATTPLPREKPVPAPKEPTKWEQFAAKKGIKPKTREARRTKGQKLDEDTGVWERTWGYDGRVAKKRRDEGMVQRDWVVEVDEKKEREEREQKDKDKRKKRKKN